MRLFSRLMPREGRFFELFNRHAVFIVQGGALIRELLENYDSVDAREARIARISEAEHGADRVTRETISLLRHTFVTPLDRDDIHRLISRMDDILDLIQDTAESLGLYDIQRITPDAVELARLVHHCCERVQAAVALLSSMKHASQALKICQEIDALESDGDRLMREAISKLFREENDVRQLIKLETVYQLLESATDRCQDVANVIESVVLENA